MKMITLNQKLFQLKSYLITLVSKRAIAIRRFSKIFKKPETRGQTPNTHYYTQPPIVPNFHRESAPVMKVIMKVGLALNTTFRNVSTHVCITRRVKRSRGNELAEYGRRGVLECICQDRKSVAGWRVLFVYFYFMGSFVV